MTIKALGLLLRKQVTQKWGRFLLASGGIMIGIWAITLTSSLSLGLSDTIVRAINSQAGAREITVYKTPTNQTSFFEITEAPSFVPLSLDELEKIKSEIPQIVEISPRELMGLYFPQDSIQSCVDLDKELKSSTNLPISGNPGSLQSSSLPTQTPISSNGTQSSTSPDSNQLIQKSIDFVQKCPVINALSNNFSFFYESNRTNWVGSTTKPKYGEIVTCFRCGSLEFDRLMNVSDPKDLVGKEITLEYKQAPNALDAGRPQSVIDFQSSTQISTSVKEKFKITAVIDDRKSNSFNFTGGNLGFYLNFEHFQKASELKNPNKNPATIGYAENTIFVDSYENVDSVIKQLQERKYLPLSITQSIISGIKTAFVVLTVILAGFGFIALVASIFGIINVMTISVLERKKEIGVLKSLGAKDFDIFQIFFYESALLGFIGWLLGTLLALGFGNAIGSTFKFVIEQNETWRGNLEGLNINSFYPLFPWWLLIGNLLLALFFTCISGIYPAIRASKQNPVDVLRSE